MSRPDISASVNYCSRFQSSPTEQLWKCLKQVLRYIKGTQNLELFFDRKDENVIVGYADETGLVMNLTENRQLDSFTKCLLYPQQKPNTTTVAFLSFGYLGTEAYAELRSDRTNRRL
ncbi:hypothetical protein QE152_g4607 [Popillia japonica]|uniref:Uncharacterized protein n=1 Tax=Popillia japonica TaxID=7064 RepID=A0AAW1N065_POPJA